MHIPPQNASATAGAAMLLTIRAQTATIVAEGSNRLVDTENDLFQPQLVLSNIGSGTVTRRPIRTSQKNTASCLFRSRLPAARCPDDPYPCR